MLTDLLVIDGRMGRARYFRLSLLAMLLMTMGAILLVFPVVMSRTHGIELMPLGVSVVLAALQLGIGLWIAVAASIRRLHDMGWSALWLLACAVPVEIVALPAMIVLSLAMSVMRGMPGENAHGPPVALRAD